MNRQEKVILVVGVLVLAGFVTIRFKGGVKPSMDGVTASLKAGLADATTGTTVRVANPWDTSVEGHVHNSWTCPPWSMASVGVVPLRKNHPLHRRPTYIGHNRHKVMCDGWNGWYYDSPVNEVL